MKPTSDAQRVRVGPIWGWYVPPPTPTGTNAATNIGTLAIYEKGRLVHVSAAGTNNDLAASAQIGSIVVQHF